MKKFDYNELEELSNDEKIHIGIYGKDENNNLSSIIDKAHNYMKSCKYCNSIFIKLTEKIQIVG